MTAPEGQSPGAGDRLLSEFPVPELELWRAEVDRLVLHAPDIRLRIVHGLAVKRGFGRGKLAVGRQ